MDSRHILIKTHTLPYFEGLITHNENPKSAELLLSTLPFESKVNLWGDEIYFDLPVEISEENSRTKVEVGEIAVWPEGPALCIFFGATPLSPSSNDIRAYSPVNVIGRLLCDPLRLKDVKQGESVRVELGFRSDRL